MKVTSLGENFWVRYREVLRRYRGIEANLEPTVEDLDKAQKSLTARKFWFSEETLRGMREGNYYPITFTQGDSVVAWVIERHPTERDGEYVPRSHLERSVICLECFHNPSHGETAADIAIGTSVVLARSLGGTSVIYYALEYEPTLPPRIEKYGLEKVQPSKELTFRGENVIVLRKKINDDVYFTHLSLVLGPGLPFFLFGKMVEERSVIKVKSKGLADLVNRSKGL